MELGQDPLGLGGAIPLLRAAAVAAGHRRQAVLVEAADQLGDALRRTKTGRAPGRGERNALSDGQEHAGSRHPFGPFAAAAHRLFQDAPLCGGEWAEGLFLGMGHALLPARRRRA
jgi:hypothetical protein